VARSQRKRLSARRAVRRRRQAKSTVRAPVREGSDPDKVALAAPLDLVAG
jgi:hypothetical protein